VRIAVVGPTHPIKGGIAQHTTVLAQRLAAAGHSVEIVSWLRQYPQRLYPGEQTVTQPELPPFEPTRRVLSWNRPDTWAREARRLRDRDLVVFAHVTPVQVPSYLTMITAMRRPGPGPRIVVLCHNVLPHERQRADVALVSRLLRAADLVLTHSDEQRDLAMSLTDRPVVVAQLPPSMPVGFARRTPRPGEHRRLLFFGLVRPYKGLDVLLRALARGPADVQLRVAGEVWGGREPIDALCRELGIADRVELRPGYVDASVVPELFADVDALVLPYRTATGSQAVWIGFEFGVPVIATRAGYLAADVRDGVDGLVAEPDDVDSLVDAIDRFYRPGVPERMRAEGRPVDPEPYWDRYLAALLGPPASREVPASASGREPQLAYSQVQAKMLDEQHRRTKARKILSVLHHYLGAESLTGLSALDIGCSAGFIADELARDGADTTGVDIDEPGLLAARARFGHHVRFVQASGADLPFEDESFDVVIFNHIYEHVVDPDAVLTEIHRTLKPSGVAYLGLGNKYQVVEPHYRLPFLSWLPQSSADRYVRTFKRADEYYESYRSRAGLTVLARGFHVWDYTIGVVRRPGLFHSGDQVRGAVARVPAWVLRAATPIMPTYIWLASKRPTAPRGLELGSDIEHLDLTDRNR
jgi:glycosyltransferase involved in cell wall biosynthesis/2-polyprenyl-3-methyl-5-hydroxy-6-metoxy-1,4-benzoquinol methylase